MAKVATLIGRKGETWSPIAIGKGSEMRERFKKDSFAGFDCVRYLDTSGTSRRKKGAPAPPKKVSKAKTEG